MLDYVSDEEEVGLVSTVPDETASESLLATTTKLDSGLLPEDTEKRASKFEIALGENSPGRQAILKELNDGREDILRDNLSTYDKIRRNEATKRLLMDNLESGTLTQMPEILPDLMADFDKTKPVDTILEEKYVYNGNDWIRSLGVPDDVAKVEAEDPMGYDAVTNPYEVQAIRNELVNTKYEELKARTESLGWGEWGWNFGKQMLELPSWTNIILDSDKNVKTESLLPGDNIAERVTSLHALPPEKFKEALDAEIEFLYSNNPLDARDFIQAMQQYSYTDAFYRNAFALSVIPMGTAAKTATKAGKKVVEVAKPAGEVAKTTILKEAAKEAPFRPTNLQEWTDVPLNIKETDDMPPGHETSWGVNFKNANGNDIYISPSNIKQAFKTKAWTKSVSGGRGLPEDAFRTEEEFKDFVIQHEVAHADNMEGVSNKFGLNQEDWTTINALGRMGRQDILAKVYPEVFPNLVKEFAKRDAAKAAQDINTALSIPGSPVEEVAVNSGRVEEATEIVVQSQLAREAMTEQFMKSSPETLKEQFANMLAKTTSFANPRMYITGAESLAGGRINDILDLTRENIDEIGRMANTLNVSRLPNQALKEAFARATEQYKNNWHVEDTLMDIKEIAPELTPVNAPFLEITHGTNEKLPFAARGTAYNAAEAMGLKPGTFRVVQQGNGYLIKTFMSVDESIGSVWEQMMPLENMPRNDTWTYVKALTGANTSTAPFQASQRATASQGQTAYEALLRKFYAPLSQMTGLMSKKDLKILDKVMHLNRITERVPGRPKTRGMFYRNRHELDAAYQRIAGRNATDLEEEAYGAFVRGSDLDYIFRSMHEFKRKSIKGIEELEIKTTRKINDRETVDVSHVFEGKETDDFSFLSSGHKINIAVIDRNGIASLKKLQNLTEAERDALALQLRNKELFALRPFDPRGEGVGKIVGQDSSVAYILTPSIQNRNPLRLENQVNYRQGFHNEAKAGHFLKQPKIRDGVYEGDITALAGMSQKQIKMAGKKWETARQLLQRGDMTAFRDYVNRNLDMSPDRFESFFKKTDPTTGEVTGHLDLTTPFVAIKRGTNSLMSGNILENGNTFSRQFGEISNDLDRYHNYSSEFGDPFTASRDEELFQVVGDADTPLWGIKDADQYNPMFTQIKSMGNLIKSHFYNDLQLTSALNYVEAFKGKLMYDGIPVSEAKLRSNPLFYLQHATIDTLNNPKAAVQAWTLRTHLKNLLGEPSLVSKGIEVMKQKLLDGIFTVKGQKGLDVVPDNMIPMLNDPFQYARSIAFHSKLGMFNTVQLFVQGMAINNVALISPKAGLQSFVGTSLMHRLQLTESKQTIEHFGDIAEKIGLGWNKKKFVESKNLLDQTAFDRVGGETSFRSTSGDPNIYRGTAGKVILDAGPVFFNAGERIVRLTGWNTAYLEWAAKNPSKVGKATRADTQWILDRAKVFSSNMTRDSNSFWQNGIAGNFTQFWSYNVRMAELMIGKQLTVPERMRLVMGNMLLYGFTPAAGVAAAIQEGDAGYINAGINPWAESLRTYAIKHGHNMDESLSGMLYQGIYSLGIEALTGAELGIGERYGMSPLQVFQTVQENYKDHSPFWATIISLMGPSGNITSDIIESAIPIARDVRDMVTGDIPTKAIFLEDIQQAFKEVSGVSNYYKIYAILNSQNYLSKNGNLQVESSSELNKVKEIIKTVTGLTDVSDLDAFKMLEDSKQMDKDRNAVREEAKRYVALWASYVKQGRYEEAEAFKRRAQILLSSEYMTNQSRMDVLFPKGQGQTPTSEVLEQDWLGRLPPDQRKNAKEILDGEQE